MKKYGLILALLMASFNASAFSFGNDTFKFTGDAYVDAFSSPTETFGIGRVSTITQGSYVVWTSGQDGQYLNFVFGGFAPVVAPVSPVFNYVATGGFVDFYSTASATAFDALASFATASASITSGDLFLSTLAVGNTIGIAVPTAYSANGFLNVVGGLFGPQLDTNSRATFNVGEFADLSFGLTGAARQANQLVNSQYTYISSVNALGASVAVPEPGMLMMLGLGLLSMGFVTRKQSV